MRNTFFIHLLECPCKIFLKLYDKVYLLSSLINNTFFIRFILFGIFAFKYIIKAKRKPVFKNAYNSCLNFCSYILFQMPFQQTSLHLFDSLKKMDLNNPVKNQKKIQVLCFSVQCMSIKCSFYLNL
jgi:hypothetical protein